MSRRDVGLEPLLAEQRAYYRALAPHYGEMAIPGVGESTLRSGPGSVLGRGLSRPDRSRVIRPPRPLSDEEINALLAADVPARLATLDREGFPHVTPLWFIWDDGAFYLTSFPDRRHVRRLERDPRAGICIDVEGPERSDGERPNRQVRAVGTAELSADERGLWTRRITRKYVTGAVADERAEQRAAQPRTVIRLAPARLVAVASV